MLYAIAHFLRNKLPFIWDLIDLLNSWLFGLRYGNKPSGVESATLQKYGKECNMKIVPMREVPAEKLEKFFAAQPEGAYEFFKPYGFDAKSIKKIQRLNSFLAYIMLDGDTVAGYCFIRSFFHGKGFRGRMVSISHRGRGLGTLKNRYLRFIKTNLGMSGAFDKLQKLLRTTDFVNLEQVSKLFDWSKAPIVEL